MNMTNVQHDRSADKTQQSATMNAKKWGGHMTISDCIRRNKF